MWLSNDNCATSNVQFYPSCKMVVGMSFNSWLTLNCALTSGSETENVWTVTVVPLLMMPSQSLDMSCESFAIYNNHSQNPVAKAGIQVQCVTPFPFMSVRRFFMSQIALHMPFPALSYGESAWYSPSCIIVLPYQDGAIACKPSTLTLPVCGSYQALSSIA